MNRKARRKVIEQLVSDHKIETQDELLDLLTQQGIETTQATISRDIHALNIVKANDGEGHTYYVQLQLTPEHDFSRLYTGIRENVRTIETVQFINVVKNPKRLNPEGMMYVDAEEICKEINERKKQVIESQEV